MYTYNATVLKVIDGDTLQLNIDLGFRVGFKANCRLNGLNTSELNSKNEEERLDAIRSKAFLESTAPAGSSVKIVSASLDKYGRPLIELLVGRNNINQQMISEGYAKPYKV